MTQGVRTMTDAMDVVKAAVADLHTTDEDDL